MFRNVSRALTWGFSAADTSGVPSSETQPAESVIYAPLRVRINCVSTALFTGFMVVAFLGALLGWALNSRWAFLAVGLLVVFPTVRAVRRGARVRLVASDEGVLISNTWRNYEIRWSEVDGVGIRQAAGCFPQPVLWFRLVGRPSDRLRLWWLKRHPNGRWARFLKQLGA